MEINSLYQHSQGDINTSDSIFENVAEMFLQSSNNGVIDDKDRIVNEQEQNEIVNPAEEEFKEDLLPEPPAKEVALTNQEALPRVTEQDSNQETNEDNLVTSEK